jgi:hypothetical protein
VALNVFGRKEFQRKLSLLDRISRWISRQNHTNGPTYQTSGGSSGASSLVLFLVAVVLVAVLVWIIVRVARTWVRSPKADVEADEEPVVEVPRTKSEWRSEADQAEVDGRWKDAILARYRELVAELVDRQVVDSVPGRTTGELRGDVSTNAPSVSSAFSEATLLFELPWYGDLTTGPEENQRFKGLATSVLQGAPAIDRGRPAGRQPVTA